MASGGFQKRREALGDSLRELRRQADLDGKAMARLLGWNAPKVSKVENGRQTVSDDDLTAWLTALNVDPAVADQLRAELAAIRREYVLWKDRVRAGHRGRQEDSVAVESAAKLIRAFESVVVPGLLQTAEYARHVLLASASLHGGGQDIAEAVRARMRRQQVLFEPGKTIEILMTEAALLHPVAPADVMAGQVHRLIAAIGTPNVRVGIIPIRTRVPYPLAHGFWIIDDLVQVETVTAELEVTDPDEVATYNKLADMLWSAAAERDDARALLTASAQMWTGA
ncbi:helix-turn-helix domain-containing protein [Saccharothrix variisporea]|uniref:Helix-turn-helix protein n=1 Tax=Saccharothrix variisporea TaxID=543527 RepID=A0A495X6K0_9PSEU|nr:helix-turn-helix transcriptional regulator [Saccharothrix variisporea]RKT67128.1 helix-turn-helix protein [Saccharothrix variisporea]